MTNPKDNRAGASPRLPRPAPAPQDVPLGEILAALAAGRIRACYQPVVRFSDGVPLGIEALARLEHPVLGTLTPGRFVPKIEAAGLGWNLAASVIPQAMADWRGDALRRLGLRLAVNLPVDVLLRPGVAGQLESWRVAAGIEAGRIVVEVTETCPIDDPPALAAVVARLQGAGYGMAMDDVSPHLRHHEELIAMKFTAMKLDKAVVQDRHGAAAGDFLDRAIEAARAAGLLVIAEGVENAGTWARMQARGVDAAQGFLISRPLTAAAMPIWLADRRHGLCA